MRKTLSVFFILVFFLSSCTLMGNLTSEHFDSSFTALPFFENLASDVSAWTASESEESITDSAVAVFADNLKSFDGIFDISCSKTDKNSYEIEFSYKNIDELVALLSEKRRSDILSVTQKDGHNRLNFNLNLDNWNTLTELIPILQDPNLEVYGPVYNNPPYDNRTAEDYYYMIDFIFGSGSEDIAKSFIDICFKAPSDITLTDGVLKSSNEVIFSILLIDIILLHNSIEFFCEW